MKLHPEQDLQMQIVDYLRKVVPKAMVFCSLNGVWLGAGTRAAIYVQKLRKMGLRSGEPDLRIHWLEEVAGFNPRPQTLFIELKIKPNKVSQQQAECMVDLQNIGFPCEVIYSFEEAIKIFKHYGLISLPKYA